MWTGFEGRCRDAGRPPCWLRAEIRQHRESIYELPPPAAQPGVSGQVCACASCDSGRARGIDPRSLHLEQRRKDFDGAGPADFGDMGARSKNDM